MKAKVFTIFSITLLFDSSFRTSLLVGEEGNDDEDDFLVILASNPDIFTVIRDAQVEENKLVNNLTFWMYMFRDRPLENLILISSRRTKSICSILTSACKLTWNFVCNISFVIVLKKLYVFILKYAINSIFLSLPWKYD